MTVPEGSTAAPPGTLLLCSRESPTPEAKMSSKRAKAKTTKKRPQRATSNVFAMFDQSQIQEFKEAFNMIDQEP
ncbi:myosin regulatory light chain 2, smooth muscle minor isoform isoform X1 [Sigmodon hispidus]